MNYPMTLRLSQLFRRTCAYGLLRALRSNLHYRKWVGAGKPVPPPHIVKEQAVLELAERTGLPVFIETGTFLGDMVYAVKDHFDAIYSIELQSAFCAYARKRFRQSKQITILQGDSGEVLASVLPQVKSGCLFWLDGHYSSGVTAKGRLETPIAKELNEIAKHPFRTDHVILIDDARCFIGDRDYPSVQTVEQWARKEGYDCFEVKDDIIRIWSARTT